jgi:hypothetical protein
MPLRSFLDEDTNRCRWEAVSRYQTPESVHCKDNSSHWTNLIINEHPQHRGSTNRSMGVYETSVSHAFLGMDVVPLILIVFVR